ncbi:MULTISPECIES: ABC transporter ATP-binding protein [Prauserella salsuginis group]|uniref:ABC transporter ATP-binding protein n=1 Tax=Prauserella salsuginis TaxID=387889 RepID=A0ABW6G6Q7_9PSEU|nr:MULTISPECIES: ABC transporter ATP-binding protein [Prauserella salsuginis group]MCR3722727.1 ABC-2 type transport system ATP-binding protein [Prauserella flava]MCR3737218.1 ABC-2 type transport system ATP-binding protein [Prauserella salsuginis]
MAVIEVRDIHKRYGETIAVDGVDFDVEQGEIFGVLGRNGAGKTTTVEIIEGLRTPDTGTVRVLGLDPVRDRRAVRTVLGVQLQEGTLPDKATAGELVRLYRSFYADGADPERLLGELGIDDKRDTFVDELSGGQLQRLSIALALVGRPRVAVLDELTSGLDPRARRDTWDLIEQVRAAGVTILLVTHFMDEAQRLCDRIAVFDRGRIAALDTPDGLVARTHATGATLDEAFLAVTDSDSLDDDGAEIGGIALDDVLGSAGTDGTDGQVRS